MLHLLRAALTTLVVLGLASAAHTMGGGSAPTPLAVAVLGIMIAPAVWWVSSRELTPGRMAAVLGASQVLVHGALVAMAPGQGSAAAVHVHGGSALPTLDQPMVMAHLTPSMLAMHAVATGVTAVVLARGERALWWVLSRLLPEVRAPYGPNPGCRVLPAAAMAPAVFRSTVPLGGRAPPSLAA